MPTGQLARLRFTPPVMCLSHPNGGARTRTQVSPGLRLSSHCLSKIRGECDLCRVVWKRKLFAPGTPRGGLTGLWGEGWARHGFLGAEVSDLGAALAMPGGGSLAQPPLHHCARGGACSGCAHGACSGLTTTLPHKVGICWALTARSPGSFHA